MNFTKVFTIILAFLSSFNLVFAQGNSTGSGSGSGSVSNGHVPIVVHPSLVIVVGVLSTIFSLTLLILACARFCHSNAPISPPHILPRSMSRFSGIDKKAIESLPFFRFSSLKGSKQGLECAVCLSRFEDSEVLRLLPKCRHVFHVTCIDEWLERHSSCPLCRYKFDVDDLTNFTYSSSLRYPQLEEGLEFFVRKEEDNSLRSSFRKFERSAKEELLIGDTKHLDKFKHRIIMSGIVSKARWSDVNSSDFISLNSTMISDISSKRFSPPPLDERVIKFKEDMGRKRLFESNLSKITRSNSWESSSSLPPKSLSITEVNENQPTMMPSSSNCIGEKRSMSEITNVPRFMELSTRESLYSKNNLRDERIRRVWLPIARRTVQWFSGRETCRLESRS